MWDDLNFNSFCQSIIYGVSFIWSLDFASPVKTANLISKHNFFIYKVTLILYFIL